jgi:hypothetical protein
MTFDDMSREIMRNLGLAVLRVQFCPKCGSSLVHKFTGRFNPYDRQRISRLTCPKARWWNWGHYSE